MADRIQATQTVVSYGRDESAANLDARFDPFVHRDYPMQTDTAMADRIQAAQTE